MIKLCIVTGPRAEYGLLYPLIKRINEDNEIFLELVVTGSHLSREFGSTFKDIESDGFIINKKIDILLSSDTSSSVGKSMGLAIIGFSDYFETNRPDMLIVLGDRYEICAVTCAATLAKVPIAHIHGGEVTEGAYDEAFRHSITKMSSIHFTSCDQHMRRVIQLGEQPTNVYNVGALGIENILNLKLLNKKELEDNISFELDRDYALVTFHPVTLESNGVTDQVNELLSALENIEDMKFIITKANADNGGREINELIDNFVIDHSDRFICFISLGQLRYLSAMKYASMVIGNSSSGIIETPSFKIPTINIGSRQSGRLSAESVINCLPVKDDIIASINKARSMEFLSFIKEVKNPYGDGNVSNKIVDIIKDRFRNKNISVIKKFYDLDFN